MDVDKLKGRQNLAVGELRFYTPEFNKVHRLLRVMVTVYTDSTLATKLSVSETVSVHLLDQAGNDRTLDSQTATGSDWGFDYDVSTKLKDGEYIYVRCTNTGLAGFATVVVEVEEE